MNVIFRADANAQMGTGHLMRCLALAQAWQDASGHPIFVMAAEPSTICLLYTSPSPRDRTRSRMPSSA